MGLNKERLTELLLNEPWHKHCEIVREWMPPFPRPETRPKVVVKFDYFDKEHPAYLRYSLGPAQGFFWDIYPDDMQEPELAVIAISKAPYPRNVAPVVFKIKI